VKTISAQNEHKALTQYQIRIDDVLSRDHLPAGKNENLLHHCDCISEIYSKLKQHHSAILQICKQLLRKGYLSMSESLLQHNDDVSDVCDFLLQYNIDIRDIYNNIPDDALASDIRLRNCATISAACNDLTELCIHIRTFCENLQASQGDVTYIYRKLLRYCSSFSITRNHLRQLRENK
jgi:hypothetical protein